MFGEMVNLKDLILFLDMTTLYLIKVMEDILGFAPSFRLLKSPYSMLMFRVSSRFR